MTYSEETVRVPHRSAALAADTSALRSGGIQGNTGGVTLQSLRIVKREPSRFVGFQPMCLPRCVLIGFPGVCNQLAPLPPPIELRGLFSFCQTLFS